MLKLTKILIEKTEPADNQYRFFDTLNHERLKYSIKAFGQIRPIYVIGKGEGRYECFEGRKILKAMYELGEKEIYAIEFEDNGSDAGHISMLMNELKFWRCDVDLALALKSIKQKNFNILPFNTEETKAFEDLLVFDWKTFAEKRAPEKVQPNLFGEFTFEEPQEVKPEEKKVEEEKLNEIAPEDLQAAADKFDQITNPDNLPTSFGVEETEEDKKATDSHENCPEKPTPKPVMFPYVVIQDGAGVYHRYKKEEYNEDVAGFEVLYEGSFSDCQIFINEKTTTK